MSLGKRLIQTSGTAVCNTETVTAFGADAAYSHNVALYQLDGNDNDTTGNYSGIAENNITYASGYIGNAAVFNGSSSSIELPNSSLGITDASNFSISYWFNTNSTTQDNQSVIWANGSNAGARFGSGINSPSQGGDTSIYFGMPVDGSFTYINSGTSAFTADTWVHVVGVKSSITGMSLYVNNVLKATNTSATGSASATATGKNSIGMYYTTSDSSFFNGEIDQLRIFNREITPSEVAVLYAETSSTASNTNPLGDGAGVALYSMDYDASETSGLYDGTPTDIDFGVGGQINTAAKFNGSSSRINLPVGLGTTGARSNSLWIKVDTFPSSSIETFFYIGAQGANENYETISVTSTSKVKFQQRIGSATDMTAIESSETIIAGNWYHIATTHDGTTAKLYINGDLSKGGSVSFSSYVDNSSLAGNLGAFRTTTPSYDGSIDQYRRFHKALLSTEVSTLYAEQACVHTATTTDVDYPVTNAAYYKFDNSSVDSHSGTYDGTESNIEYRFGRYGQAAVFNGVETASGRSKITTSGLSTYNNFSISFWMNSDDLSNSTAALVMSTTDNNSSQAGFNIFTGFPANNNITWIVCNGSSRLDFTATANLTENQWHHIVITQNTSDNTKKIYIDGSLSGTSTSSTNVTGQGYSLLFGGYSTFNNNTYDGKLDQIRIFASELSAENVTSLYNEKPETDTSNFKAVLYTGNGATQFISNVGMDLETSGGLVWVKNRSATGNHSLIDNVRGVSKPLNSNEPNAEQNYANFTLTSFEKNGFFVTDDSNGLYGWNGAAGGTYGGTTGGYVGWVWKGGGAAVQNNDGTINGANCIVSANTAAGFSIVNYVGTGSSGATFGHGLGAKPDLILIKNRDKGSNYHWTVYSNTSATGATGLLYLNLNDAFTTTSSRFNDTEPTSSVVTLGNDGTVNQSGDDHIAYCFTSITGYSSMGTYEGNGNTATTTITTGFEPSWVMIKRTDSANSWVIFDNKRDTTSPLSKILYADTNDDDQEGGTTTSINITSTNFNMSTSQFGGSINTDGGQYLYLAIK